MKRKCVICLKALADHFRVCRECSKKYDSTTGDRITALKKARG